MSTSIICDCGGRYTQNHRTTHMQTQRHIRFVNASTQAANAKASIRKRVNEASFEPTDEMCAICMDPMTTKETTITSCNHRYCTACFASHAVYCLTHSNRYVKNPITCPMCRTKVVAVACQVQEYDPYTKRLIQERDFLQHQLLRFELVYTKCARSLAKGIHRVGVPEAIQLARHDYLLNMEQILFQRISSSKHRLNQVESQLRVAKEADVIVRTQTTRMIWLETKTDSERDDIHTSMEELKVVV